MSLPRTTERRLSTWEQAEPLPGENRAEATYRATWARWLRRGVVGLTEPERRSLQAGHQERAMGVSSDVGGGFLAPQLFQEAVVSALKDYSAMRNLATVHATETGGDYGIPTDDDESQEGEILTEGTIATEQDAAVGLSTLRAYTFSSKRIRASLALVQDSPNFETWLAGRFAARIGRAQNRAFTIGTGADRPTGVVTSAVSALTAAATTAVTYAELVRLQQAVDPAYRARGRFVMNDNTLLAIRLLTGSDGHPMVTQGPNGEDRIDGKPVTINYHLSDMATGARAVLFGDFSNYHIRDAGQVQVLRLVERYAESGQVAFMAFQRSDGLLVDAGTGPVKCITMA